MIKEAFEYLVGLSKEKEIRRQKFGDVEYTNNELYAIYPPHFSLPSVLTFPNLTGLVAYILRSGDGVEYERVVEDFAFLHVTSPLSVSLRGIVQPENRNTRFHYATAEYSVNTFPFNSWVLLEDFVIGLQSLFVQTDEIEKIIDWLGNLASENVKENRDDGFSQTIQIRSGVNSKSNVTIENPINVIPYRTFQEIEQPASMVIMRIKKEGDNIYCKLVLADGGIWEIRAMDSIVEYLKVHVGACLQVV